MIKRGVAQDGQKGFGAEPTLNYYHFTITSHYITASMADVAKLSHDIDSLLEQYLQLLDQYTTLREQLNVAQSSVSCLVVGGYMIMSHDRMSDYKAGVQTKF